MGALKLALLDSESCLFIQEGSCWEEVVPTDATEGARDALLVWRERPRVGVLDVEPRLPGVRLLAARPARSEERPAVGRGSLAGVERPLPRPRPGWRGGVEG